MLRAPKVNINRFILFSRLKLCGQRTCSDQMNLYKTDQDLEIHFHARSIDLITCNFLCLYPVKVFVKRRFDNAVNVTKLVPLSAMLIEHIVR